MQQKEKVRNIFAHSFLNLLYSLLNSLAQLLRIVKDICYLIRNFNRFNHVSQ